MRRVYLIFAFCFYMPCILCLKKASIVTEIDNFINGVLNDSDMTGASLAVVLNGKPFLTTGYGLKNVETREPVDENTMFVIASLAKAFVATTMAKTIEENQGMSWKTRVHEELEDIHLSDPGRTQEVNIRDLLSHRTGLPGNDMMRMHGFSIDELMGRLRFLEFTQDFRDGYKNNNLMYGLASYVIQKRYNQPWEDVATDKLFRPLHMNDTTFVPRAKGRWNEFATAYARDRGGLREIPLEYHNMYYGTITAPGGVSSNAKDMAKWLIFHMKHGESAEGARVVSEQLMKDLHIPVNALPSPWGSGRPSASLTRSSRLVGLGWFEGHYNGWPLSTHSGFVGGYTSHIDLVTTPDNDIGVFVALNGPSPSGGVDGISSFVLDLLMGRSPRMDLRADPSPAVVSDVIYSQEIKMPSMAKMTVNIDERGFVGQFGNFAYGNITVYREMYKLFMRYGDSATYELVHVAAYIYTALGQGPLWRSWYNSVTFEVDDAGRATKVKVPFESEVPAYEFVRDLDQVDAPAPREPCDNAACSFLKGQSLVVTAVLSLGALRYLVSF